MSVKLYRHSESGEVVAAILNRKSQEFRVFHSNGYLGTDGKEWFLKKYTPLPEAPEVGSTAWAWQMLENGEKVCNSGFGNDSTTGILYIYADGGAIFDDKGNNFNISFFCGLNEKCWQLYEAPKPIVELLPHEFVQEQPVLARKKKSNEWVKCEFDGYLNPEKFNGYGMKNWGGVWPYCLPYTENAHLEGQITDGEHGAVPRGYVPPYVPQFGEDGYWCVGDEVVNLCTMKEYKIAEISSYGLTCEWGQQYHVYSKHQENLRNLYHKGSYVREDGTVHEHIPTRPHKKIDTDTCDA